MLETTSIVAISSAEERLIKDKTLSKLSSKLLRILLSPEGKGCLASLELLIQVFYLVDILGDIRKIDLGRLQVSEYGLLEKLDELLALWYYDRVCNRERNDGCIFPIV